MLRLDGHSRAFRRTIPFQSRRRAPRRTHLDALRPRRQLNLFATRLEILAIPATLRPPLSIAGGTFRGGTFHWPTKLRLAPRPRYRGKRIDHHKRLRPILHPAGPSGGTFQSDAVFHAHLVRSLEMNRFLDARPSWRNIRRVIMKFQNRILLFAQPLGSIRTIKKTITPPRAPFIRSRRIRSSTK